MLKRFFPDRSGQAFASLPQDDRHVYSQESLAGDSCGRGG